MDKNSYVSARLQVLTAGTLMFEVLRDVTHFQLKKITDVSEGRNAGMLYPGNEGTTVFQKIGSSLPINTV
jgi:hypothetical protein